MAFLMVKTSRHLCREVKVEDRFEEYDQFQFLIGNLIIEDITAIYGTGSEFQFLIGNLIIDDALKNEEALDAFQFLIGNLIMAVVN